MPRRTPDTTPSPLYKVIGGRIREARNDTGLSQDELAKAVRLTRTSITNLENGNQQVPLHTLFDIARALGRPVHDLIPTDLPPRERRAYGAEDVTRWATQLKRERRASA